ncbi:hypothetical protein SAMN05444166_6278 [Singulisphaera sp. GP187]|uniref:phage tail assembly protein T n=1 Tax=Singulisphaera sp. GP187 TaxID=1882752 RepID=UPI00092CA2BE|nr:hypothetical protein [Singulisphaera sp. GP187]SIO60131.1 hypothetical protein SAMN05444166_6278 [Singulisphaera sp. GP187]
MPVRELLSRIDSHELSEWLAYDRLDPLPDSYWQAGLISSTIANVFGKGKALTPEDFIPRRQKPKSETQSAAAGLFALRALAAQRNGRV